MKILEFFKRIYTNINFRVNEFLNSRYAKYIIDYKVEGDNLRIITNLGDSRIVKNTPENQAKLNRVVIRSKVDIAKKIDKYEDESQERLIVFIFNIMFLGISGLLVPFTFFIGSYLIFLLSIFLFSFLSLATSVISIDYYVLVEEVRSLKRLTGYRKDMEFELPNLKNLRNEIK